MLRRVRIFPLWFCGLQKAKERQYGSGKVQIGPLSLENINTGVWFCREGAKSKADNFVL
jgi:hypothetical protein